MKTFEEFLDEATAFDEYDFIKKIGYKKQAHVSGRTTYVHPANGSIHVNTHGHWHHQPHGSSQEDGFEGTTGASLKAHLDRLNK